MCVYPLWNWPAIFPRRIGSKFVFYISCEITTARLIIVVAQNISTMQLARFLSVVIYAAICGNIAAVPDPRRVEITHATWDGVGAYILVAREAVQEKLDEFHKLENAPKLYMPTSPVFPDILTTDHHVVYVDFGYVGSIDFASEPSISSYGTESAIIIPFLADCPNGIPKYALTLGQFYQRDRGDIARVNINSPYYGIDEVSVTETGAVWRNGSEELRVSFVKSNPCHAPKTYRRHEFDVLVEEELEFSFTGPDLGYCDHHLSVENPVCDIMECIKTDVDEVARNVCQFYQPTSKGSCEASLTFENISEEFRRLLLVTDDPITVVNSERFYDEFDISLKYPCLE